MAVFLALALGLAVGGALAFLARGRSLREADARAAQAAGEARALGARLEERAAGTLALERTIGEREAEIVRLRAEAEGQGRRLAELVVGAARDREALEAQRKLLDEAREKMGDAFKALSADLLRVSGQEFFDRAKALFAQAQESQRGELEKRQSALSDLVKPVAQTLERFDVQLREVEKARASSHGELRQQLEGVVAGERALRTETANLVAALRRPEVRGRWGELQLERVVEFAGMKNRCDFTVQASARTAEGEIVRPDLVVHLAGGKHIVVDSKAPLSAYLEAIEAASPEERDRKHDEHARQVRQHAEALSRKAYWEQFQPAPEFVVLFLPGEAFFSAALERDPELLERVSAQRVVLASPTTLIAMLRAVAHGWREESVAENARAIRDLGSELYKRLSDLSAHFAKLGRSLKGSVDAYNQTVGSLEARVLVSARRLEQLEAAPSGARIEPLGPIEALPRQLEAVELTEGSASQHPA